ncbi:Trp biosynthesis-associated membrane protein [Nocardioides zeae]|uniref:Trp biosynthesis-associated membrane protein n=1 Tax=Nocardioides imazamoxiresistens TaxID=3231893 RepID=A0ABU3PZ40_9ACTN|nr:Trp biosynthesis-associated membrane protein [Nocardioides zeae]MDT9594533.1 Trp biosynthesis-associated membrane protein [Nocardioides zeae]
MSGVGPGARRTFGPVVLVGVAAAGLVAFGGTRTWADTGGATGPVAGLGQSGIATTADLGESPLAAALGLVVLACWGVVLVTRRWFRRVVAGLGAVASLGVVAVAVAAARTLPDDVAAELARSGTPGVEPTLTWWLAATGVAALVSALAFAAAVRLAPSWPEMGSRYDAPGGDGAGREAGAGTADTSTSTSLDLWKAIDAGDDPTAGPTAGPTR